MVVDMDEKTEPSAGHSSGKSRVGGACFVSSRSAKGINPVVAKDTEPEPKFGEIDPQEVSDIFWAVAGSNSQNGSETLVDTPIQRFLASSFDFLALLVG